MSGRCEFVDGKPYVQVSNNSSPSLGVIYKNGDSTAANMPIGGMYDTIDFYNEE